MYNSGRVNVVRSKGFRFCTLLTFKKLKTLINSIPENELDIPVQVFSSNHQLQPILYCSKLKDCCDYPDGSVDLTISSIDNELNPNQLNFPIKLFLIMIKEVHL